MPGVPSGRGCDACRKQKKKCDQSKPACSRCSRLQIQCIGSGQRRFKFKEQSVVFDSDSGVCTVASAGSRPLAHAHQRRPGGITMLGMKPSSETTRLNSAFVNVLEIRDVRYSMATYGLFMSDTPRRVGKNKALDASVKALTTAHPILHTGQQSVDALSAWVQALNVLRSALHDPEQATSIETLIAIYYVYICQTWLGRDSDAHSSHAEGMAYILNTMAVQDLKGEFECRVFITLSAAVIFESFLNPQLKVNPIIWEASASYNVPEPVRNGNGFPLQSLQLRNIVDYARVLRDPEPHHDEVQAMYAELRKDTITFGQHIRNSIDPNSPSFIAHEERRCHMHAGYGLGLGVSLMFNGILNAYTPHDPMLLADAVGFIENVLILAEQGLKFRPLGSSWMSVCLLPAWAVSPSLAHRAQVDQMILEYESVPFESGWVDKAYWFQQRLEALRWRAATRSDASSDDSWSVPALEEPEAANSPEMCCVM